MKITKKALQEYLDFSLQMANEAGDLLLSFQKKRRMLEIKSKGAEGIASEADTKVEKLLLNQIKKKYPDHHILSEEDFYDRKLGDISKFKGSDFVWMIDPLDGTNNFVNGIPIYAVSIALVYQDKPIVGVVYNPISGECFFASLGFGAYMIEFKTNPFKKYKLWVEDNKKLVSDCIFSPSPLSNSRYKHHQQLAHFSKSIIGARALRRLGSAAVELCYVANGNFDGYWEENLKPWDVAAAGLICSEANIRVTSFGNKGFSPYDNSIIAASPYIHKKILGTMK
jgi:myo-inositol-1(or 4)-monophosphatase